MFFLWMLCASSSFSQDSLALVRKAAEKSTLDQRGTHAFHLKATLALSSAREADSRGRGEIEVWWKEPGVYRRELRSLGFHQLEIVNGGRVWQKNEGDYMPEWLDQIADAMLHPVPARSAAMRGIAPDKTSGLAGSTYLNWEKPLAMNMQPSKEDVAITDSSGLLFYDGGLGWGALFKDYQEFHGLQIARTVANGSPEVSATVALLEDLPQLPAEWFNAGVGGSDAHPLAFRAVEKTDLASDVAESASPLVGQR